MTLLRPDPTFYPSTKMAMEAPAEKLAYLALLNPKLAGKPDAIAVVDVDPASRTYSQVVG
jgi:methanethiol oxidase